MKQFLDDCNTVVALKVSFIHQKGLGGLRTSGFRGLKTYFLGVHYFGGPKVSLGL